jgi:predicted Ser/Thr protein kinase
MMKPERWRQIDELFAAALERSGPKRAEFLDHACAGDTALRLEVEKMLNFEREAAQFIETDVFDLAAGLITGQPEVDQLGEAATNKLKSSKRSGGPFTSESIDDARFISGELIAERYRIVGLLGRGGMGEVYRADDLKLKQSVALKFLPEDLSRDSVSLTRFYREVSVARQISHRHVCRVYDVGEFDGQHFISMEFIRGEDLGSLLKRIGRLPEDKALQIARQLSAGLSAVHERGILHRDLKPANIMVDEHGNVRVTDFGIAALAEEVRGGEAMAGTPAYMSPEQFEGGELTVKSDIYSLGVVIYEIFTGRKAFDADSLPELLKLRRNNTQPSSPSELVVGLDPLVERVIFRCLERNVEQRPASALEVAAALPGGDPLSAALAAGETPSPEMVAAAPKEGELKPAVAVSLLATLLVLLAAICFLSKDIALYRQVPLDKSPEVLRDRAWEITKKFGYVESPRDTAYGMGLDRGYLQHIADTDPSVSRWNRLKSGEPASIYFWYRQSPIAFDISSRGQVLEDVPALNIAGMTTITLDTLGRLRSFNGVPPEQSSVQNDGATLNWSILFSEAGLDLSKLQSVSSTRTPPHAYTTRAAWEGSYPSQPDLKFHIEAAAYQGKPVYFDIVDAWDLPVVEQEQSVSRRERTLSWVLVSILVIVMVGSTFLTWRNLRSGRGDRKGAARLATFMLVVHLFGWIFTAHHVSSAEEILNFISSAKSIVFWTGFFWVVYIAFEPFVRRRWPGRIISWTRLLAGSWRDPLVGRDILIGAVVGIALLFCNFYLSRLVPQWLGSAPLEPWMDFPATQLLGVRSFGGGFSNQIFGALIQSFMLLFFLLMLRMILRRDRLAAIAAWLIGASVLSLTHQSLAGVPFAMIAAFLAVAVLYRYGLLATVSAIFVLHLIIFYPVTSDLSAWYAGDFLLALIVVLALAVYGFYISLAGQPVFRRSLLDD